MNKDDLEMIARDIRQGEVAKVHHVFAYLIGFCIGAAFALVVGAMQ